MAQNKCPLCGSRISNGYCTECGYNVPDESSIAATYNYDPSDYNLEQRKYDSGVELDSRQKNVMPELKTYEKQEIDVYPQNNNPYNQGQNVNNVNKTSGQYNANPYQGFNPAANQSPQNGSPFSGNSANTSGFADKDFITALVVSLLFPFIGIFYIIKYVRLYSQTKDSKYTTILIILGAVMFFRLILQGFINF